MLDLIEALATRVRGLPLLLLTLSRPELHDTRAGWANGISAYTALTLAPLGEQHARELAVRRLGDTDRVDEVIRVAEGNPLFIEQLAMSIGQTAPGGTETTRLVEVAEMMVAVVPLKLTESWAEFALKLDPEMVTEVPIGPDLG